MSLQTPPQDPNSPPRDTVERLEAHGQQHLLRFWDRLTQPQRKELIDSIATIDLSLIAKLFAQADALSDLSHLAAKADPPRAVRLTDRLDAAARERARQAGVELLRAGKVGTVLVAGGQGTRLGFDHPKGMFSIGPVSGASLFQILFEQIVAVGKRYDVEIPLWLMTSPATHEETEAFLKEHDYFGLSADQVTLFCQGCMPIVDAATGQLLLEEPGRLSLGPDGHGGMVAALARTGALERMRERGIEQLFYFQIDNPLVRICDPTFLGHHVLTGSRISTQVVPKQSATDRLGNVVSIDGRMQIIEYSDLSAEVAGQTNADGSLRLWAGSTAIHAIDVDFLRSAAKNDAALPYHIARKAAPFVDESGATIEPDKPNAIKFERFIFDLLPAAKQSLAVEISREQEFAPVKNDDSAASDTPQLARQQMVTLHREWLAATGAEIAPGALVEFSPLFALDAAEVQAKITSDTRIVSNTYFR